MRTDYVVSTHYYDHNILCRNVRKFKKFTASVRTIPVVSMQYFSHNILCRTPTMLNKFTASMRTIYAVSKQSQKTHESTSGERGTSVPWQFGFMR